MRAALWFLALFGVAAAIALFAGNNQGTVTVFWPPYRIDLSLNLVLLSALGGFAFLYAVLRALSVLFDLPRQATRWRRQQKERALHGQLVDAIAHLLAGRFLRARKAADAVLVQEESLRDSDLRLPHANSLRALAHLVAAESSQALQDRPTRDSHLADALQPLDSRDTQPLREGVLMRAARWSLDDREPQVAGRWLAEMSQGAARRTLALRMKLKAQRLLADPAQALETARLLAKHRAFSTAAAESIVRGLAIDLLNQAHDLGQLQRAWNHLESSERAMPDLAIHAARRLQALKGDAEQAREWLLPVWERHASLSDSQKVRLVQALEAGLESVDSAWLARFEGAQRANPRDAGLQYLAGMACMKRQLWGKAQQLLMQAALGLQDTHLHRRAWRALAELAESRGDLEAAGQAWKRAATE
jgi:HemY protein